MHFFDKIVINDLKTFSTCTLVVRGKSEYGLYVQISLICAQSIFPSGRNHRNMWFCEKLFFADSACDVNICYRTNTWSV